MPGKKEESYFVRVSDPIEVRRSILESSKNMIHFLQKYERFKTIRQKKIENINKLNQTIKEIHILVSKLRAELPKLPKRRRPVKKEKEEVEPVKPTEKKPVKIKSELDRLEEELSKVEEKLTHLE